MRLDNPAARHPAPRGNPATSRIDAGTARSEPVMSESERLEGPRPSSDPHGQVRRARMAGLLYLAMAILGGFAQVVRVRIYVPEAAVATASNVAENATLLRLSVATDLVQALVWSALAVVLYRLLRSGGELLARFMVVSVGVSISIAMLNLVSQLGAVVVATTPSYPASLGRAGADALVQLLMTLQYNGYLVAQLSWLWLFALGLLGLRSALLPRAICYLLMLGTIAYALDALVRFLAPERAALSSGVFFLPELASEVALLAYLLIRGVRRGRIDD